HGHLFDIKSSLMKLEYRAQEVGADIICFGHSHVAYAENINGRLFINPGSIRLPRQFPEGSYAKLNWTSSEDIQLESFNIKGEEITNLPYRNKFSLKYYNFLLTILHHMPYNKSWLQKYIKKVAGVV